MKTKMRRRLTWAQLNMPKTITICPHCKRPTHGGHFVPPMDGNEGFFLCERKENQP